MTVLVTGASGFVGRALVSRLATDEATSVRAAVRRPSAESPPDARVVQVGDLNADTDWRQAVQGCETVVHAAARVHLMRDDAPVPLAAYREANVDGTVALARQAAAAGVRRFIFLSSIKVNGEATRPGRPFRADDVPAPVDAYGISKAEAEERLRVEAEMLGLSLVIIRPVLVYGPGVRANFDAMLRWVRRGIPLPLASVDNRRSFVALDNLVDLVRCVITHPAAPGRTFLVSDDDDLSTAALLRRCARALEVPVRLVPVPPALLLVAAALVGKRAAASRLLGNLQVDIAPTRRDLLWNPVVTMDQALRLTVAALTGSGPGA